MLRSISPLLLAGGVASAGCAPALPPVAAEGPRQFRASAEVSLSVDLALEDGDRLAADAVGTDDGPDSPTAGHTLRLRLRVQEPETGVLTGTWRLDDLTTRTRLFEGTIANGTLVPDDAAVLQGVTRDGSPVAISVSDPDDPALPNTFGVKVEGANYNAIVPDGAFKWR